VETERQRETALQVSAVFYAHFPAPSKQRCWKMPGDPSAALSGAKIIATANDFVYT
jgi:hypothetical protein